jgi:hypothetical protein
LDDEGLCLNIGDLVLVTGIEDAANGQEWRTYGHLFDNSIVQLTAGNFEIPVNVGAQGYEQSTQFLTAMASGQTTFQIQQIGPCQKNKRVDIAFYVNPERCPSRGANGKKDLDNDHGEYNN